MRDPWDRIQEHEPGLRWDDFYCAKRGDYGHPDVDPGKRQPREGWLERGREALSFGSDTQLRNLVMRFSRFMNR
jgi:hypothetical protein